MDKAKVISALKAIGGFTASIGGVVGAIEQAEGLSPKIAAYAAVIGIAIHGLSTGVNEVLAVLAPADTTNPDPGSIDKSSLTK